MVTLNSLVASSAKFVRHAWKSKQYRYHCRSMILKHSSTILHLLTATSRSSLEKPPRPGAEVVVLSTTCFGASDHVTAGYTALLGKLHLFIRRLVIQRLWDVVDEYSRAYFCQAIVRPIVLPTQKTEVSFVQTTDSEVDKWEHRLTGR